MNEFARSMLGHLITAIVAGLFVAWLAKSFRTPPRTNRNGEFILEYPFPFKVGVTIVWLIGTLVTTAFYLHGQESIAFGVFGCVAALGFPLYLVAFTFYVEFDALNIRVHTTWRPVRLIPWGSVRAVTYHRLPDGYVVNTATNGTVRLKCILVGLEAFLDQAERHGVLVQRVPPIADRMMQRRRS